MTERAKGPLALLRTRRFAPLFLTQFLGAFNDNVFKNALIVLLTFKAAGWSSLSAGLLANLAAGLFILPFFLFSASAGQWADSSDKAAIARRTKLLEVLIVLLAGVGFLLHSLPVLFAALFLLGAQSALFGPVKYAILPQHLEARELLGGNALIEAATFVAILLGTILGGVLAALDGGTLWITLASLVVALAGVASSWFIPNAAPPSPGLAINWNFAAETWAAVRRLGSQSAAQSAAQSAVLIAVLGISWFWLYGALLLAQFPAFGRDVLGGDESVVTSLLAVFTVGIGAGSLACERLSRHGYSLRWVPVGAIGITAATVDLALASTALSGESMRAIGQWLGASGSWRVLADILAIGAFGGLFIVPLYTRLQTASDPANRARMIAANNIVNALFMVMGALVAALLLSFGVSIPELFVGVAVGNVIVLVWLRRREPEFFWRRHGG